jgi:DNA-binding transcriptional LysR family regulator
MNIMKLHIVVLIEKYKKVTDVAAELGVKQPTVSFHMKTLETELGTPLFQYRNGRVLLTEAGRTLYQYAVKIVALATDAERSVKQFSSPSQGHLKLEASPIPGSYLLPQALTQLMKLHPGIDLSISVHRDGEIRERLRVRDNHFALLHSTEWNDDTFHFQLIERDEPVLIFAPGHPFDGSLTVTTELVAREPWVQHAPGSALRGTADKWAQLNSVRLWNRAVIDSPEILKELVSAGEGMAVFSKKGIEAEISQGRLRYAPLPGDPPNKGGFLLVWRKDHLLTPLEQAVLDYFAQNGEQ